MTTQDIQIEIAYLERDIEQEPDPLRKILMQAEVDKLREQLAEVSA